MSMFIEGKARIVRLTSRVLVVVALGFGATMSGATRAADDAVIDRLEAGVNAAEGVRAVKRLQHAYGHFLEAGLWSDLGDLFADDATGDFAGATVSGKAALKKHFMDEAARKAEGLAPGQLNVHIQLQPIVTLGADGATARGAWHEVAMLGHHGKDAAWKGGVYENEYARRDGVWRITRIRYFPQYAGAFDDYGHKAPARWNIPYHFEAKHVGITVPATAYDARAHVAANRTAIERGLAVAHRLARLEDEAAVQNLQHAFGYYLDRKLYDDVADLFAGERHVRGGAVRRVRGRGAHPQGARGAERRGPHPVRRALRSSAASDRRDDRRVRHAAAARTSQLGMLGRNGEYARWIEGTYENEFVKEGGVWKLAAVHYYPHLATDYDLGWARDAQPAPAVLAALAPDRGPTQKFSSFPAAQTVGFHFVHPVTGRALRLPSYAATHATTVKASTVKVLKLVATPSNASGDPAVLQRRLDAAIAFDAVENLMSSYGYYIDESAWDDMADTYAQQGGKEITGAGMYIGPDRIRKILKLRGPLGGRTANFYTIHQLTQPVITVAADGKSAKARMRLFQAGGNADGSSGSWIGGIYENTAIFENGEWKFGIQDLHHIFNASYRNGWARAGNARGKPLAGREASPRDAQGGGITQGLGGARGGNSLGTEMPPDRPIRARQYSFPEVSEPAFHYVNPVSGRAPPELMP